MVIVILGIVAAVAIPMVSSRMDEARQAANEANLREMQSVVALYRLDTGFYPSGNDLTAEGYGEWQDILLSDTPPEPAGSYPDWDGPYLRKPVHAPKGYTPYEIEGRNVKNFLEID